MLKTEFKWQCNVSSLWVISWNNRVEGGRVLKDLRCGEQDLGVGKGGQMIFRESPFFRFSMVLRYC